MLEVTAVTRAHCDVEGLRPETFGGACSFLKQTLVPSRVDKKGGYCTCLSKVECSVGIVRLSWALLEVGKQTTRIRCLLAATIPTYH